jgi:hypothetical protein
MARAKGFFTKVSDILGASYRATKGGGLDTLAAICLKWKEIGGEQISRHSYPVKLRGRTLTLRVEHAAWMQELSFLKLEIAKKANDMLGRRVIDDIRFEIGDISDLVPSSDAPRSTDDIQLGKDAMDFIESSTSGIGDEEVRRAAASAMASALSKGKAR